MMLNVFVMTLSDFHFNNCMKHKRNLSLHIYNWERSGHHTNFLECILFRKMRKINKNKYKKIERQNKYHSTTTLLLRKAMI